MNRDTATHFQYSYIVPVGGSVESRRPTFCVGAFGMHKWEGEQYSWEIVRAARGILSGTGRGTGAWMGAGGTDRAVGAHLGLGGTHPIDGPHRRWPSA